MADFHTLLGTNADTILKEIGVGELSDSEKAEVMQQLVGHFQKVILETILVNLDKERVELFKEILEGPQDEIEDKMVVLTGTVPGLAEKIEEAVRNEIAVLKSARAQIK